MVQALAAEPLILNIWMAMKYSRHKARWSPWHLIRPSLWTLPVSTMNVINHVAACSPHPSVGSSDTGSRPDISLFHPLSFRLTEASTAPWWLLLTKWSLNIWQRDEEEMYKITAWPLLIGARWSPHHPDPATDEGPGLPGSHLVPPPSGFGKLEISPCFNFSCAKWKY